MTDLLIYSDEGAGARSLQQLVKSLRRHTKKPLKLFDRHYLLNHDWEESTHCLIFPGGRDVPYHEALKGKVNDRIKKYMTSGGRYLGICAGAYYACKDFIFEKGSPLEILALRELGFYPGSAIGPAYGNGYYYQDERAARIAHLNFQNQPSASYYNGGCYFADAEKYSVEVIAHYADIVNSPAAIIQCPVGLGSALLCGVHPEYRAASLHNVQDPYLQNLIPDLHAIEDQRKELFTHLLDRLSI